jgi:hypothetical protein
MASFNDYAAYAFDKLLEIGLLSGLYQDNSFPWPNHNTVSGNGYVRDDGKVQVGWDMWAAREFYRRYFVIAWERTGKYPLIMPHDTNAYPPSVFSWATIGYDLEMNYGGTLTFQEKFPADFLRAGTGGRQSGIVTIVMGGQTQANKRSFTGSCLVHDMRSTCPFFSYSTNYHLHRLLAEHISYMEPDFEVLPYWSNEEVVDISSSDVKVTLYRHGNRVLAVVCHYGDGEAGRYKLALDTDKLGLPDNLKVFDLEELGGQKDPKTGEILRRTEYSKGSGKEWERNPNELLKQTGPGTVEFDIKHRHDFRLLLFKPGE